MSGLSRLGKNYVSVESITLAQEAPVREDWLNPISMSKLQLAVKRRATTVVLNGDEFSISYGHMTNFPANGETRESICLRRTDGVLVPFGYVAIETILAFEFEQSK